MKKGEDEKMRDEKMNNEKIIMQNKVDEKMRTKNVRPKMPNENLSWNP